MMGNTARPLREAGTFDARGTWRELDAPPAPEGRAFVDALDRIPFVPEVATGPVDAHVRRERV